MTLVVVPNLSEGRDDGFINTARRAVLSCAARVLDLHVDASHNRTVITAAGEPDELIEAAAALAEQCMSIDLTLHVGAHPRLGGLDVFPFVPQATSIAEAIDAARRAAAAIYRRSGIPVYLYGSAATRAEVSELPDLRRGGLDGLIERALAGLAPDLGSAREIDRRHGVVCVGARGPLIAFNVWLRCEPVTARAIARAVRASGGGLPGVRALGLAIEEPSTCQVSMNLIRPADVGIEAAFAAVDAEARNHGAEVVATELVGLVPERFLPGPDARVTRLLIRPGHSLETMLRR